MWIVRFTGYRLRRTAQAARLQEQGEALQAESTAYVRGASGVDCLHHRIG